MERLLQSGKKPDDIPTDQVKLMQRMAGSDMATDRHNRTASASVSIFQGGSCLDCDYASARRAIGHFQIWLLDQSKKQVTHHEQRNVLHLNNDAARF